MSPHVWDGRDNPGRNALVTQTPLRVALGRVERAEDCPALRGDWRERLAGVIQVAAALESDQPVCYNNRPAAPDEKGAMATKNNQRTVSDSDELSSSAFLMGKRSRRCATRREAGCNLLAFGTGGPRTAKSRKGVT